MGISTVGSPTNTSVRDSDRRGESPSVRSDRAGHVSHFAGKGGPVPAKLMRRPDDGDLHLQHQGRQGIPFDGDNNPPDPRQSADRRR
jgi:hypothetical protein